MSGFYLMHRGWMDNGVFADEPFTEREAFEWMISQARWEAGTVPVLGGHIQVERGQFSHSLRFMAERFKWSKSRMENFMTKMRRAGMLRTANRTASGTDSRTGQMVTTVCNYDIYQSPKQHQQDSLRDSQQDSQRDKEEINKQVKQEKEYVATRARGENFFREIYDAGSAAFPYLATRHTEVINRWLEAGADPERDVLPLFRQAKAGGKEPRSWNYFTGAVMDAISAATKPLPQGNAANHKGEKKSMSRGMMEAAARAAAAVEGNKP